MILSEFLLDFDKNSSFILTFFASISMYPIQSVLYFFACFNQMTNEAEHSKGTESSQEAAAAAAVQQQAGSASTPRKYSSTAP